jgi:hypothetical protein
MKNINIIITSIILTLLVYCVSLYFFFEDSKVCDELVIMNDGSQIESTSVYSDEYGMTTIRQCNGEEVRIPTINIKMVKELKK